MFDVIVVGTDGSTTAQAAVDRAAELAAMTGGTLHIVHAYRPVSLGNISMAGTGGAPTFDIETVNESLAAQSSAVCDHAAAHARARGVTVDVHPAAGDPADAILTVAHDIGADLVVVGNRGMSGTKRFVLGSVPNKVSHHCPCSLLIVDTHDA